MKRCLVIDDSRVIRTVACGILMSLDYEVCDAEDGVQGLDSCWVQMPDVILLDLQMSSMSAMDFVRNLRRAPGGKHPFILLSMVEKDVSRLADVINAGADEYIMKPFDRETLAAKLARMANSE